MKIERVINKTIQVMAAGLLAGVVGAESAGVIVSPTAAVINAGGPGFCNIEDTFNQNGLAPNFISGVTDFDTYIAADPQHTITFSGYEWFSNAGTTTATITYDLGARRVNRD